jgi:hypothetical protein
MRHFPVLGITVVALSVAFSGGAQASKSCDVNYTLDNAGTISTGWIHQGNVTWPSRKQECKNLAIDHCQVTRAALIQYAPVGSANFNAICNAGGVNVYFDTKVGNLKKTKDGNCKAPVTCTRAPCPWTGYGSP